MLIKVTKVSELLDLRPVQGLSDKHVVALCFPACAGREGDSINFVSLFWLGFASFVSFAIVLWWL